MLEAGVCLTGFYFAEWGLRADGFWLHNVLLNGVWELNGFNKQCVEKKSHLKTQCVRLVTREIDGAPPVELKPWMEYWVTKVFTI